MTSPRPRLGASDRRHAALALLLLATSLPPAGCTEDGPAGTSPPPVPPDAGGDPDASAAPALPEPDPPAAPAPPRLEDWPCPPGWSPRTAEEGEPWSWQYCEPPVVTPCEGATAWSAACGCCRELGSPCPEGEARFPAEAELRQRAPGFDGAVLYVAPQARPPGDGSREAPFRSLEAALASRRPNAVVALARGVHAGPALLSVPTALVGACASGTRLDLPPGARAVAGVDVATTGSAAVVDLTLSGDRWGVHIGPGDQPVALRSLVVDAPWEFGVVALDRSGVVDVSDVVVRSLASSEEGVAASLFLAGSPARLERVAIEAGRGRAVSAMRWEADVPAVLEVRDLVVAGNEVAGDGVGAAFVFYDGAGGTLERVVIDASAGPALFLSNETAPQPGTVEATDVAIRNAGVPTTLGGTGVVVLGSMDVTLRRLLVSQAAWAAVTVEHPADGPPGPVPALRLTDAVLLGPATEPGIAPGVAVADPADLELRRVYVRDSVGAGLSLGRGRHRAGPLEVLAEDIVIRGGTPIRTPVRLPGATPEEVLVPQFGGVTVYGATLDLRRAVLADVPVVGICALGEGDLSAVAVAEDLVLQRGRAAEVQLPAGGPEDLTMPRWLGFGLLASSGGMLQATRVHVEDQEGFDAMAHPAGGPVPPTLVLEDVSFGPPGAHPGGRARATLVASDGSRVRLTRARFLDGHGAAILAAGGTDGPRTEVEASHVDLAGTIHAPCGDAPEGEPGSCVVDGRSHAGGMGLLARDGARVGLTDFRVRDSEVAGIVVASDASVEGRRGTVTGNGIGINLMVQGYDLDLLSDEVYVFGNDTDVAQEQLALPDPAIQLAPEGLP